MTNNIKFSRIGCLPTNKLTRVSSDTQIKNCITSNNGKKYMATDANLINDGTCYSLQNENETIPWGLDSDRNCSVSGTIPVYNIESNHCSSNNLGANATDGDIEKCLDNGGKNYLDASIRAKANQIRTLEDQIKADRIRIMGITKNLNDTGATTAFEEEQQECQQRIASRAVAREVDRLRNQYSAWNEAQVKSTNLITKTTSLYENRNKEQQDKFDKLQNLNKEVNTLSKDILLHQKRYEEKEKITKILRTILIILIIAAGLGLVILGVKLAENKYPEAYNNFMNKFNTNSTY